MVLRGCSAGCGKKETSEFEFDNCSRCKSVCYCSVKCQTLHWKSGHKAECKKLRQQAEAGASGRAELEALAKSMSDIQRQVTETARSLAEVDARLKHNEKAHKANEVVIKEISGLPEDTPTFLTVGKMYMRAPKAEAEATIRKEEAIAVGQDATLTKKKKYLTQRRADLEKQYREIGAALVKAGVVRRR